VEHDLSIRIACEGIDMHTIQKLFVASTSWSMLCFLGSAVMTSCLCGERLAHAQNSVDSLDSISQLVVDSLISSRFTKDSSAAQLLDAAIKTFDVDAFNESIRYLALLKESVGSDIEKLADVGDAAGETVLARMNRILVDADAKSFVRSATKAAQQRRRRPERLSQALADLDSDDLSTRRQAVSLLLLARGDALGDLVKLLDPDSMASSRKRLLIQRLLEQLGSDATAPLIAMLSANDKTLWPSAMAAIQMIGDSSMAIHLFAPALADNMPAPVTQAAQETLASLGQQVPSTLMAIQILANRLNILLENSGSTNSGTTDAPLRIVWDNVNRVTVRKQLTSEQSRALDATHVSRDLTSLGVSDPAVIRSMMISRLEHEMLGVEKIVPNPESVPIENLLRVCSGPDGVDVSLLAQVLLEAVDRRFLRAAIGVTRVLESQSLASSDPLPPSVRTALVRALETPNVEVRFFAAKALAKLSGPPPFAGSSRLIETLLWCASSRGIDRAVVAHPSSEVANSIASGLSRFGYRPQVVSTGRAAILAVRDSCDVRLIVLASRINRPESFETAQLIRTFTPQEILPTLIVVDPLDDENDLIRERLASVFDGMEKLSIVDRMDDFFYPRSSDAGVVSLPRFPVVMQTLSPQGDSLLDDRTTAAARRRERGKVSLELLASLAGHGWDLSATLATARLLMTDPACATAAISLLAHSGKPAAQHALLTEALRPHISANHASACVRGFKENVRRYGILLESGEMLSLFKRYNNLSISENPVVLGKILDILEASGSVSTSRKGDGA